MNIQLLKPTDVEINSENGAKTLKNCFYENKDRNDQKSFWFDLLIEEKEKVSFGFDALGLLTLKKIFENFYIQFEKAKKISEDDAFACTNKFLIANIKEFIAIMERVVTHPDNHENWLENSSYFMFFKKLTPFEVFDVFQELFYDIISDAFKFYDSKTKKKEAKKGI